MSMDMPRWFDSEYFVAEMDNWHMREDAPEDLKKEFEEYMEQKRKLDKRGIEQ